MTTQTYQISNRESGLDLGTYEATDETGALNAMAQDAGYQTYDSMDNQDQILERHIIDALVYDGDLRFSYLCDKCRSVSPYHEEVRRALQRLKRRGVVSCRGMRRQSVWFFVAE